MYTVILHRLLKYLPRRLAQNGDREYFVVLFLGK